MIFAILDPLPKSTLDIVFYTKCDSIQISLLDKCFEREQTDPEYIRADNKYRRKANNSLSMKK